VGVVFLLFFFSFLFLLPTVPTIS